MIVTFSKNEFNRSDYANPRVKGIASSRWSAQQTMFSGGIRVRGVPRNSWVLNLGIEYPVSSRWSAQPDGFVEGWVSSRWSAQLTEFEGSGEEFAVVRATLSSKDMMRSSRWSAQLKEDFVDLVELTFTWILEKSVSGRAVQFLARSREFEDFTRTDF